MCTLHFTCMYTCFQELPIFLVVRPWHRKIFNLWVPSVKDQKKKVMRVTALLGSLTALLEYLDLFSNI